MLILDDNAPGVYVGQSGGSTLVSAGPPPVTDTYPVRLLEAPAPGTTVTVGLISDGQTSIATDARLLGDPARPRLPAAGRPPGARTLFSGNVTISGNTITLANGSELMSFLTDGFAVGQRLVIGGTGTGDDNPCANQSCSNAYLITAVTANTITFRAGPVDRRHLRPVRGAPASGPVTLRASSQPACSPARSSIRRAPTRSAARRRRSSPASDGGSWLDNGFLEGQLIQFANLPGVTYKIQSIFGSSVGKLDELSVTAVSIPGHAGELHGARHHRIRARHHI